MTALIWGTTFPITRSALAHTSPARMLLIRSAIAALPLAGLAWRTRTTPAATAGVELGLWLWAALATQTIGLTSTTAGRSAFITAVSVVLVALAEVALSRKAPRLATPAVVLCVVGIILLTYDGSRPGVGDAWTLLCALLYVGLILRMGTHSRRVELVPFVAWQLLVAALASAVWVMVTELGPAMGGSGPSVRSITALPWAAGAYLGLVATLLTTLLQARGQRELAATESAIIYSLEPVCAFAIGVVFLQESFGPGSLFGGTLVIMACVLCQMSPGLRTRAPMQVVGAHPSDVGPAVRP